MTKVSIIAGVAENMVIGRENNLLWNIPEDMKRFREITSGHPVIMGRKTFESLPLTFRPLPNRTNIVVTRDSSYKVPEGVIVVNSVEEALKIAKGKDKEEIFIIGGGQIYAQTIGLADKLYLTIVKGEFEGDTFFPDYKKDFKRVVFEKDGEHELYKYKFLELER